MIMCVGLQLHMSTKSRLVYCVLTKRPDCCTEVWNRPIQWTTVSVMSWWLLYRCFIAICKCFFCIGIAVEKQYDPPKCDFWRGLRGGGGLKKIIVSLSLAIFHGPLIDHAVIRPLGGLPHSLLCSACLSMYIMRSVIVFINKRISHSVARQCVHCCKGDAANRWEMTILWVSELRNPWTDRLKMSHLWLRRWVDLVCQIS